MPIPAQCPAGHAMMVPDHRAGTHLRCPRCGADLLVPGIPVKSPRPSPAPPPPLHNAPSVSVEVEAPPIATAPEPMPPPVAVSTPPPSSPKPSASAHELHSPVESSNTKHFPRRLPPLTPPPPIMANLPAPPKPPITGQPMRPDRDKQAAALHLGLLVGALALFGTAPAIWEWYAVWQNPDAPTTSAWVFALLLVGVLQLAYAIYLAQVPDWSALWATTAALLGVSAGYALMLGTTLVGREEGLLVMLLQYADKIPGNRAAMWCFVMLCFTSVVTYFLGLTAARWHHSYRLLRRVHET